MFAAKTYHGVVKAKHRHLTSAEIFGGLLLLLVVVVQVVVVVEVELIRVQRREA